MFILLSLDDFKLFIHYYIDAENGKRCVNIVFFVKFFLFCTAFFLQGRFSDCRKGFAAGFSGAASKIKELTGIEHKETQVRKFLKSIGSRCLQVGVVPAKALT